MYSGLEREKKRDSGVAVVCGGVDRERRVGSMQCGGHRGLGR